MPLLAGSWSNVDVSEEDGRTLEVEVHGAYDIANTQWIGKQDPYVIAVPMPSGLTHVGTLSCHRGGTRPKWNGELKNVLELDMDLSRAAQGRHIVSSDISPDGSLVAVSFTTGVRLYVLEASASTK